MRSTGRGQLDGRAIGEADEGPFVSFTDLLSGVLFIFLILIATLMLMQRENVETVRRSKTSMSIDGQPVTSDQVKAYVKLLDTQINQLRTDADAAKKEASSLKNDIYDLKTTSGTAYKPAMLYNIYFDHESFDGDKSGKLYYHHTSELFLSLDRKKIFFNQHYFSGSTIYETTYEDNQQAPKVAQNPQPPATAAEAEGWLSTCDVQVATKMTLKYTCGSDTIAEYHRISSDRFSGTLRGKTGIPTKAEIRILAIYDDELRW